MIVLAFVLACYLSLHDCIVNTNLLNIVVDGYSYFLNLNTLINDSNKKLIISTTYKN